ncbi:hypothetical protein [Pyxidicoccus trucidator]|uniref:hypothetical protein n=1 Tax=Pyxidicoccus trucidator TaxID=2709662 RepID=UPI0013D9CB07|nr:hypothetical protein [Pyxidicoccus trucidator]
MSHLLPVEGERTKLLEALAELVAHRGHATLVRAPILRPHPSHFPDAWSPDANGVRAMARRLMTHAGLGAFDVHITLYENEVQLQHTASVGGVGYSRHKEGAAAWFAGFDGATCLFGVDQEELEDVEQLAGGLAHEVAHAYRHVNGLEVEDRQHEEQLTDLTTIFLGFGLLTTNNTFRSRASGALMGSSTVHSWSVGGLGYLSPQVMSFLLAAQVVARGSEREEVRMLKRALRPTQAEAFGAALKLLEPEREALRGRLGVPPPLQWEALPPPMSLPDGVTREEGSARTTAAEPEAGEGRRGAIAFRVPESRAMLFGVLGLIAMLLIAIVYQSSWLLLLPVVGWWWGARYPDFYCSDSECNSLVRLTDSRCPGCGQLLVATLQTARERWDAEADYWRQHGGASAEQVALERELAEEARAAPPEPPVPQSGESTARIFFGVALRLVLVFGGFFAVCTGYFYFFGHA